MVTSNRKCMKSTSELIEHMQQKNIGFNISNITQAKQTLTKINYYYKLSSYRSNFPKDENGKYIHLEFAYLTDLASIDMQLRDYLMDLSLDIEHSIKVVLLDLISNDSNEDGYTIVTDFRNEHQAQYDQTLQYWGSSQYLHDFYQKRHEDVSIWVLMETMTFGTLSMFVDFYFSRTEIQQVKKIKNYLRFSKNIRNACAHSNPLLVNLFSDKEFLRHPSAPITLAANQMGINRTYLQDLKINDLVSLFYLHKCLQSKKMSEHRCRQGRRLIKRFHRHSDWYADNTQLNTFFRILNIVIDYLDMD
ncbi:DNA-binding protein [Lactiplantibacillus plantarum]|nr:DNA-binding protein [Lactiplantibacillus plantarum]